MTLGSDVVTHHRLRPGRTFEFQILHGEETTHGENLEEGKKQPSLSRSQAAVAPETNVIEVPASVSA